MYIPGSSGRDLVFLQVTIFQRSLATPVARELGVARIERSLSRFLHGRVAHKVGGRHSSIATGGGTATVRYCRRPRNLRGHFRRSSRVITAHTSKKNGLNQRPRVLFSQPSRVQICACANSKITYLTLERVVQKIRQWRILEAFKGKRTVSCYSFD